MKLNFKKQKTFWLGEVTIIISRTALLTLCLDNKYTPIKAQSLTLRKYVPSVNKHFVVVQHRSRY